MLIPIPYSPDLTNPPNSSAIQSYIQRKIDEHTLTNTGANPEARKEETKLTETKPTNDEKDDKLPSSYGSGSDEKIKPIEKLSESYVTYNTKSLIIKLINEFNLWQELGTDEGLIHVSNIKDLIDLYEPYLIQDSKNRILLRASDTILRFWR